MEYFSKCPGGSLQSLPPNKQKVAGSIPEGDTKTFSNGFQSVVLKTL